MVNPLIFKSGLGAVATVGAASGGYYAYHVGLFSGWFETNEDFLIVKTTAVSTNAANEELLKDNKKNYKCTVSTATPTSTDNECVIKKLTDKEKSLAIALNKVNNKDVVKNDLKTANNYYKIVASKEFLNSIKKWDDASELIDIAENNSETTNNIFAKVQPIYKVENGKITERKISYLLAKTDSSNTTTFPTDAISNDTKNYQCKLENKDIKFDCEIVDTTVEASKKTIIVDNLISSKTITNDNLKAQGKHFAIKISEENLNNFDFSKDSVSKIEIISTKKDETNKKYNSLTSLFKIIDETVEAKSDLLLAAITTKVENSNLDSIWTNYNQCQIDEEAEKLECSVYKFDSPQASSTDLTALSFSNLTKATQSSDITDNNYFVIKFKNAKKVNQIKSQNIKLSSTDTSKTSSYSFSTKTRLFIDASSNGETTINVTAAYILDK